VSGEVHHDGDRFSRVVIDSQDSQFGVHGFGFNLGPLIVALVRVVGNAITLSLVRLSSEILVVTSVTNVLLPFLMMRMSHSYEMNCSGARGRAAFSPGLDSLGILGMHTWIPLLWGDRQGSR
jgi:hypothetical protein